MKLKLAAMTIVALAFGTAHAADSSGGSEFFHQAAAGGSDVEAGLQYHLGSTTRAKAATVDTKTTGLETIYGQYQYGINEMFAIGGRVGYKAIEAETGGTTVKTNGLEDIAVVLEGTNAMGAGNLKYGADLGLGLSKRKVEADRADAGTGGLSLAPYVGWDMAAGPGWLGAALQYTWRGERKSDVTAAGTTTEATTKDGSSVGLSAFYEWMITDLTLGAALNYEMFSEATVTSGGTDTKFKSHNTTGIDLYSVIPMSGFSLLPGISYELSDSEQDKWNVLTLNVAGRFAF